MTEIITFPQVHWQPVNILIDTEFLVLRLHPYIVSLIENSRNMPIPFPLLSEMLLDFH